MLARAAVGLVLVLMLSGRAHAAGDILVLAPLPIEARWAVTGCMQQTQIANWRVVETGVGKVNATLAATEEILNHQPACVVQFGTAGWLASPAGPGVLTVITSASQWDYGWYEPRGFSRQAINGPSGLRRPTSGWTGSAYLYQTASATARTMTNRTLTFFHATSNCIWAVTCIVAQVVTGDAFVSDMTRRARIAQETGASIMDMETAATAEVCARFGVPFLALRAITDTPAHNPVLDFRQTANQMLQHLGAWLACILQTIDTNMLSADRLAMGEATELRWSAVKQAVVNDDLVYQQAQRAFSAGRFAVAAEMLNQHVITQPECAYRFYRLLALSYDYASQPQRAWHSLRAAQTNAYALDEDELAHELAMHAMCATE